MGKDIWDFRCVVQKKKKIIFQQYYYLNSEFGKFNYKAAHMNM